MSNNGDWFPGTRAGILELSGRQVAELFKIDVAPPTKNAVTWGLPASLATRLDADRDIAETALRDAKAADATDLKKEQCRVAFETLETTMREIHAYCYLPGFSSDALVRLGFHPHKTTHTPKNDPTDHVEMEFVLDPQSHKVTVKFRIAESTSRGKGSYHGAELRFWVLPIDAPAPLDADAAGWQSVVDTASPWSKQFPGADAGKRFWITGRWENPSSGSDQAAGKGPWSLLQGVVIP
jgi:hypothetical protein